MRLYTLTCGLELTGIAEANTKQAFIDILDRDVIGSFTKLKVRQISRFCMGTPNDGRPGRNSELR